MKPGDLTSLAERQEGSLEEVPFGALLLAHFLEQRSIALEIRHRNVRKTVLLDRGVPVECRTNLLRETFGEFLVQEGRISAFQCKEALAASVEQGVRIGVVLVERGFLDPLDLPGALQRNLGRRLVECFTWRAGEYRVLAELPQTSSKGRIDVPRLVFTGLFHYTALEQMLAWAGPLLSRPLALHHQPPVRIADLQLSSPLRNLIAGLRRQQSARDLLKRTSTPRDELVRALAALAVMGVIVVRRSPEDAATRDDDIEVDLGVESAADGDEPLYRGGERDLSPDEIFRLRNEIAVQHLTLARKGAYEVLGVDADTPKAEVRRRYIELVEHYAPARYEVEALRNVACMADDLLRATVSAYSEVTEPRRRGRGTAEPPVAQRTEPPTLEGTSRTAGRIQAPIQLERTARESDSEAGTAPERDALALREGTHEAAENALERLASLEGAEARFRSAEISFSLDDQAAARDEFLRGCALWAEASNRTQGAEPSETEP